MTDKAFWSGELSFGIVNIPFSLGITRKSHDHVFKQFTSDGHAVGRQVIDKETGLPVDSVAIFNGIEVPGVGLVLVDKKKIAALTPETNHSVEIQSFFNLEKFDFSRFDTTYHMFPKGDEEGNYNETDLKAYTLLHDQLCMNNLGAFVKIKLRHREQLCLIQGNFDTMTLSTLYYEDEIIKAPKIPVVLPSMQEINAARALVEAMTVDDSDYSKEQDSYWYALSNLIVDTANGD